MSKEINVKIKVGDIVGVSEINKNEQGIDIRINNYPYEDLSIETKQWASVAEFIEYVGNTKEE